MGRAYYAGRVSAGADRVKAINNVLVGGGLFESATGEFVANFKLTAADFAGLDRHDYRLRKATGVRGRAVDPGQANGTDLRPAQEYAHPMRTRRVDRVPYAPGAIQSVAE